MLSRLGWVQVLDEFLEPVHRMRNDSLYNILADVVSRGGCIEAEAAKASVHYISHVGMLDLKIIATDCDHLPCWMIRL